MSEPFSISCADSGTRSWFAAPTGRDCAQSRSASSASGSDWSGTLSPARESGSACKTSSGVSSHRWRWLRLKKTETSQSMKTCPIASRNGYSGHFDCCPIEYSCEHFLFRLPAKPLPPRRNGQYVIRWRRKEMRSHIAVQVCASVLWFNTNRGVVYSFFFCIQHRRRRFGVSLLPPTLCRWPKMLAFDTFSSSFSLWQLETRGNITKTPWHATAADPASFRKDSISSCCESPHKFQKWEVGGFCAILLPSFATGGSPPSRVPYQLHTWNIKGCVLR